MTNTQAPIVIIGGGHAGVEAADAIRRAISTTPIMVISADDELPYQRPPLSKDYMDGAEPLPIRGERFYTDNHIDLRRGRVAVSLNRTRKSVVLSDDTEVAYSTLILATGAQERKLPIRGTDLRGVVSLRTLPHADELRQFLARAQNVVVVGAGFIGLEFAAVAKSKGVNVTVLEAADRPMARSVSPTVSRFFAAHHRDNGVDLRLDEGIQDIVADIDNPDTVGGVHSSAGIYYPADLVLLGVGVLANDELAQSAGLATDNGVIVDAHLRTADPYVYAIGDCARFHSYYVGSQTRLECIQNATDHAHHIASSIAGLASTPYRELPWFWSVQGSAKLNIAGVRGPDDDSVTRGMPDTGKFSVFNFRSGRLTAVESVNCPADHIAARKILGAGGTITPEQAADAAFDVKAFARKAFEQV